MAVEAAVAAAQQKLHNVALISIFGYWNVILKFLFVSVVPVTLHGVILFPFSRDDLELIN